MASIKHEPYSEKDRETLAYFLFDCFSWWETDEGDEYWYGIFEYLIQIEEEQ